MTVSRTTRAAITLCIVGYLVSCVASCSSLVNPESAEVRCVARSAAADPCGLIEAGLVCRNGTCQRCDPNGTEEQCNGMDDDCDGIIDEGHDQDGDGFTWCGGGVRALADCVDTDPTIRPSTFTLDGVPEHRDICGDGIDNNCSGVPDDDPACEAVANCEDLDTPCSVPGTCTPCPTGQQCQPCPTGRDCGNRQTICAVPLNNGSSCNSDLDCTSGLCVESDALGLMGDTDKRCSLACCSDADCGSDVCLVRGNGTRLCAPAGLIGRTIRRADESCTSNLQCASGVCDAPHDNGESTCRRLCTTDADCAGSPHGSECIFQQTLGFIAPAGFVCGQAPGDLPVGAPCFAGASRCNSGLCPGFVAVCSEACRTTCSDDSYVCAYQSTVGWLPLIDSRMPLCLPSSGNAPLGASCQQSSDCGTGSCVNNVCASTCCNDADCLDTRCRPIATDSGYGMYCAP